MTRVANLIKRMKKEKKKEAQHDYTEERCKDEGQQQ